MYYCLAPVISFVCTFIIVYIIHWTILHIATWLKESENKVECQCWNTDSINRISVTTYEVQTLGEEKLQM